MESLNDNIIVKSNVTYITNWIYNNMRYNFIFDVRFGKIRPIIDFTGICLNRKTIEFTTLVHIHFDDFYILLLKLYPELINNYRYESIINAKLSFREDVARWHTLIFNRLSSSCSNDDLVVELEDFSLSTRNRCVYRYLEDATFINNLIGGSLDYNLIVGNPKINLNKDYCYIDVLINNQVTGVQFKELYSRSRKKFIWLLGYLYSSYSYGKPKYIPFNFYKLSTIYWIGKHEVRFVLECRLQSN